MAYQSLPTNNSTYVYETTMATTNRGESIRADIIPPTSFSNNHRLTKSEMMDFEAKRRTGQAQRPHEFPVQDSETNSGFATIPVNRASPLAISKVTDKRVNSLMNSRWASDQGVAAVQPDTEQMSAFVKQHRDNRPSGYMIRSASPKNGENERSKYKPEDVTCLAKLERSVGHASKEVAKKKAVNFSALMQSRWAPEGDQFHPDVSSTIFPSNSQHQSSRNLRGSTLDFIPISSQIKNTAQNSAQREINHCVEPSSTSVKTKEQLELHPQPEPHKLAELKSKSDLQNQQPPIVTSVSQGAGESTELFKAGIQTPMEQQSNTFHCHDSFRIDAPIISRSESKTMKKTQELDPYPWVGPERVPSKPAIYRPQTQHFRPNAAISSKAMDQSHGIPSDRVFDSKLGRTQVNMAQTHQPQSKNLVYPSTTAPFECFKNNFAIDQKSTILNHATNPVLEDKDTATRNQVPPAKKPHKVVPALEIPQKAQHFKCAARHTTLGGFVPPGTSDQCPATPEQPSFIGNPSNSTKPFDSPTRSISTTNVVHEAPVEYSSGWQAYEEKWNQKEKTQALPDPTSHVKIGATGTENGTLASRVVDIQPKGDLGDGILEQEDISEVCDLWKNYKWAQPEPSNPYPVDLRLPNEASLLATTAKTKKETSNLNARSDDHGSPAQGPTVEGSSAKESPEAVEQETAVSWEEYERKWTNEKATNISPASELCDPPVVHSLSSQKDCLSTRPIYVAPHLRGIAKIPPASTSSQSKHVHPTFERSSAPVRSTVMTETHRNPGTVVHNSPATVHKDPPPSVKSVRHGSPDTKNEPQISTSQNAATFNDIKHSEIHLSSTVLPQENIRANTTPEHPTKPSSMSRSKGLSSQKDVANTRDITREDFERITKLDSRRAVGLLLADVMRVNTFTNKTTGFPLTTEVLAHATGQVPRNRTESPSLDEKVSDDGVTKENIRAKLGIEAADELLDFDGKTWLPPPVDWEERCCADNSYVNEYIGEWNEGIPVSRNKINVLAPEFLQGTYIAGDEKLEPPPEHDLTLAPPDNTNERPRVAPTSQEAIEKTKFKFNSKTEDERSMAQLQAQRRKELAMKEPELDPFAPTMDLYLRPATQKDSTGIAEIYNFYISNSIIPEEQIEISDKDVIWWLEACKRYKLPFIVAIKGDVPPTTDAQGRSRSSKPILPQVESVIGFAMAGIYNMGINGLDTGRSRCNALLHLYVKPEHKHKGVGRNLFDRLLHSMSHSYGHRDAAKWVESPANIAKIYNPYQNDRWHQLWIHLPIHSEEDAEFSRTRSFLGKFYFYDMHTLKSAVRTSTNNPNTKFADLVIFQGTALPADVFGPLV